MKGEQVDLDMLRARVHSLTEEVGGLKAGGGGGTLPPMDRVAVLEAHMEHVREGLGRLATVPADIAEIKANMKHLPSKGFIVGSSVTLFSLVIALLAVLKGFGVIH